MKIVGLTGRRSLTSVKAREVEAVREEVLVTLWSTLPVRTSVYRDGGCWFILYPAARAFFKVKVMHPDGCTDWTHVTTTSQLREIVNKTKEREIVNKTKERG